jgi:hypothetical protein|nr:MAG TPA: hypothetical protein [Bacteriophage sp.]
MNYKSLLPVEAIIARLDNDFNIDNSDYIPRIAAWCIDLMNQMKVLKYEEKSITVDVDNRFASFPSCCDINRIRVFDENGCEVDKISKTSCGCPVKHSGVEYFTQDKARVETERGSKKYPSRRVIEYDIYNPTGRNYVVVGDNMIELNYDAEEVTIKYLTVVSYFSQTYNCELPVIPNNGKLIECLEYFCMYKILSRGIKHPVFSLNNQLPTNPYLLYRDAYNKAYTSIIVDNQDVNGGLDKGWNQFFYNSTFPK